MENPQLSLFQSAQDAPENPMKAVFSREFFKKIPETPGIYWMFGRNKELLYVGKAKNLRARLRSYRNTRLERHSSKTRRLVLRVQDIQWEICRDEPHALLRENEFLRALKPPFNVVGVRPETYLYFAFKPRADGLLVQLLFHLDDAVESDMMIFGAFKGIHHLVLAHASILRWIWSDLYDSCDWPAQLTRKTAPKVFLFPWQEQNDSTLFSRRLIAFLDGEIALPELILPQDEPSAFLQKVWLRDQLLIEGFFRRSLRRHRLLRERFGLHTPVIGQENLDDYLTLSRFRLAPGRVES